MIALGSRIKDLVITVSHHRVHRSSIDRQPMVYTLEAAEKATGLSKSTILEAIEAGTIDSFGDIDDVITKTETEIAALEQRHLDTRELGTALSAAQQRSEIKIAQSYEFRCLVCKFEWATWLKPSITFVSLSFVTAQCPNCRHKHVPAFKVASNR
jgi:hypothetical protein